MHANNIAVDKICSVFIIQGENLLSGVVDYNSLGGGETRPQGRGRFFLANNKSCVGAIFFV